MPNARLVSLDLGNGYVKYRSSTRVGYFPSVYAIEEPGVDFEGLAGVDDFVIRLDGNHYAIGWSAPRLGHISVRTLDRTRVMGDEYAVLFAAALAAAVGQSGDIAPVLSLPVMWYDRRDKVRERLAGDWTIWRRAFKDDEGYHPDRLLQIRIPEKRIRIVPEGFGSICSLALNEYGTPIDDGLLDIAVGVVDMGTKTLDLSKFDRLRLVPARTKGFDEGVGLDAIYNILGRQAERELGYSFTIEQLDAVLYEDGPVWVGPYDVSEQMHQWKRQALEQVANAIAGHIKSLWQGGADVQKLLLTGGGAQHVFPYLSRHFPHHLEPVPAGAAANCNGAYLYGLLKEGLG